MRRTVAGPAGRSTAALIGAWVATAAAAPGTSLRIELLSVARPDPYVVSPAQPLELRLRRSGATAAPLHYRWTGPRGEPLGSTRPWPADSDSVALAPRVAGVLAEPGFAALEIRSNDASVSLNQRPAGYPLRLGIVVAASPTAEEAVAVNLLDSPFAMVHPPVDDERLAPWVKRLSWTQSPSQFVRELARSRAAGLVNVPLLHGKAWKAPAGDEIPFDEDHERALRARLAAVLDAVVAAGLPLPTRWQAGLESNRGDLLARPLYHANYAAKLAVLRAELEARAPGRRFELVASFSGFDYEEYRALRAGEAWPAIDVLSANLYRWREFPMPDTWLPQAIDELAGIAGDKPLVIGEMGNPVRGQPDPEAFYGYPAKHDAIPGAAPHEAANYMVRAHVLALASGKVQRLYWYNYRNRGARLDYAEHHFGLRAWREHGNRSHGHPLPAYASYVTMVRLLSGRRFASTVALAPGVTGFRFEGSRGAVVVAWRRDGDGPRQVPLADLPGVARVTDLFGASLPVDTARDPDHTTTGTVPVGMEPVYIELLG